MSYIPLFWKFLLLRQESNNVTSRMAHPVHCTFKHLEVTAPKTKD